jgi:hypothetical protein
MLRFKILASAVPLIVAGLFARERIVADVHPCIAAADAAVELAPIPWQANRLVAFTSDPAAATVRVQLVDDPAGADFTVVDGEATRDAESCAGQGPTRLIGIGEAAKAAGTVIYLSRDGDADYRIYVRSKSFTAEEAAALIVGANGDVRPAASRTL